MTQLMAIAQKQDAQAAAAVAASKGTIRLSVISVITFMVWFGTEEGEVKGEPDPVDTREDGKDVMMSGKNTKHAIIYLSHVFKEGALLMDLANFLKEKNMIADALPLALRALQAHSWTDETASSTPTDGTEARFAHMSSYLELARRQLEIHPPTSINNASVGGVDEDKVALSSPATSSSEPVDYLHLAKSMALELVTRFPTRFDPYLSLESQ
jgi:hypothetical protein